MSAGSPGVWRRTSVARAGAGAVDVRGGIPALVRAASYTSLAVVLCGARCGLGVDVGVD